jgi:hypothetical protein
VSGPERFHLTLTASGHSVAHGWWPDEAVSRAKFIRWIGEYGTIPGARLTLVDEAEARLVAAWPDET